MPRARTFKQAKIAYTGDLPDRDKIPNWIKHAGGKISSSKTIDDDVTHIIISKNDWKNYKPIVKEARRRGTIYLMKHRWLIDSISINKGRLCDETLPQYTWEKEHAKRVLSKMKRRQQDVKKATKTAKIAKIAAKIVGQTDGESGFAAHSGNDRGGTPKTVQSVEDVPNDVRRKPQVPRSSPKQIIDCGIKFDKALLESERDMALKGYRPYVDQDGLPYLITLVRRDVARKIKEQYDIKAFKPFYLAHPNELARDQSVDSLDGISETLQRFTVSDLTDPHYLNDLSCCPQTKSTRQEHVKNSDNTLPTRSEVFEAWEQHVPFSAYPITTYDPDLTVQDAYGKILKRRVHLPRPFAYSLQLYESFDRKEDERENSYVLTPTSTSALFISYLSQPSRSINPTAVESSHQEFRFDSTERQHPSMEKKYFLLQKYTRKGRNASAHTHLLVPMGSSYEIAFETFLRFFKRKTGIAWNDAKQSFDGPAQRRDGGIGLSKELAAPPSSSRDALTSNSTAISPLTTSVPDTTGTLGASFYQTSVQIPAAGKENFRYVPNTTKDLQEISDAYAQQYHEHWLPSHARIQACALQPSSSTVKGVRTWAEVVSETKPQPSDCDGHRGAE